MRRTPKYAARLRIRGCRRKLSLTRPQVRARIDALTCAHPAIWLEAERLNPLTRNLTASIEQYESGKLGGIVGLCQGHRAQHRTSAPCICGEHDQ